jgi:hypothetical protein
VPGLHSRCDLSVIEVGFEEHRGANEVELHPVEKLSLRNLHSFEEEAIFAAS